MQQHCLVQSSCRAYNAAQILECTPAHARTMSCATPMRPAEHSMQDGEPARRQ